MQPILVWRDCWIPSEELSLPKKERKASQTFQNCLNITPSFEILLSSVLPTYLQQMLSQFQIVICKRSIRSGKDSGDLQSNTQCLILSIYADIKIHIHKYTRVYTHLYIYGYIQVSTVSILQLREKNSVVIWLQKVPIIFCS